MKLWSFLFFFYGNLIFHSRFSRKSSEKRRALSLRHTGKFSSSFGFAAWGRLRMCQTSQNEKLRKLTCSARPGRELLLYVAFRRTGRSCVLARQAVLVRLCGAAASSTNTGSDFHQRRRRARLVVLTLRKQRQAATAVVCKRCSEG